MGLLTLGTTSYHGELPHTPAILRQIFHPRLTVSIRYYGPVLMMYQQTPLMPSSGDGHGPARGLMFLISSASITPNVGWLAGRRLAILTSACLKQLKAPPGSQP